MQWSYVVAELQEYCRNPHGKARLVGWVAAAAAAAAAAEEEEAFFLTAAVMMITLQALLDCDQCDDGGHDKCHKVWQTVEELGK